MSIKEYAQKMIAADQVFKDIADQKETLWVNSKLLPFDMVDAVCQLVVSDEDIADAEARLQRFAPYIKKCFPETAADMNDPYNAPFILQEYEGIYRNGEIEYTVRNCWTDFMRCGLFELANAKKFKFYMYIDKSSMPDETVGSYTRANKKYFVYQK